MAVDMRVVKTVLRIYLTLCIVKAEHQIDTTYACGPSNNCTCENTSQMDCSKTELNISSVCNFIGNWSRNTTILGMKSNRIENISRTDLKGCENINELDLSLNEIKEIEQFAFEDIHNLSHLNLRCNNFSSLYTDSDINLGLSNALLSLNISGNANLSMPAVYPSLPSLYNLEKLLMDGLQNKDLPSNYTSLLKLEKLDLSGKHGYCGLRKITKETFESVPSVKFLYLSKCKLQEIHAGGFKALTKLEVLDLSRNVLLGFLPFGNVSYSLQFTNIKVLNYSKVHETYGLTTELRLRDICFLRNTSLVEIDLSGNRLALFEQNAIILMPDSLNIIWVEDNKLSFGLYLFQAGCLSNATAVYASQQNKPHTPTVYDDHLANKTMLLTPSVDSCPFMKTEYLISKTNINCPFFEPGKKVNVHSLVPSVPRTLQKFEFRRSNFVVRLKAVIVEPRDNNVEYIDMSGNVLNTLQRPIWPLPKLKHVDLSQCYCSKISTNFFNILGMYALETLLIQQNLLGNALSNETIGSVVFNKLVHLKTLNLSSNTIPSLPSTIFLNLKNLETLDLSVNNLETVNFDVDDLTSLIHLNLRSNFIQSLPMDLLQRMEDNSKILRKDFTIDMRDNSIRLSCESKSFLSWLYTHKSNMVGFSDYKFVDEEGKHVSDKDFLVFVRTIDKDCNSYMAIIVTCTIGISVYLAVLIGAVIYKNRWNLRYILRNAKIRHFRYRQLNDIDEVQYRYDVFISYANENNRFVFDKCMPNLENEGFKLCMHDKDFLPGNDIADNIVEAILNSRKTICIISKAFLKSQWCLYEFNMARMESIYDRNEVNCLIVVLLRDFESKDMPTEMLHWIRTNTYIEYTDDERFETAFWELLQEALEGR